MAGDPTNTTDVSYPWHTAGPRRSWWWGLLVLLPLVLLALFRVQPVLDVSWENHPAHFWLVLAAAAVSVALGYTVTVAARRRRDGRLFLLSLGFIAGAGFLGLHALATPGVLIGPNPGFEFATPVGLLVASVFVAASSIEFGPGTSHRLIARWRWGIGGLLVLMLVWGGLSLARLPPLDDPLQEEALSGWQTGLAATGVALYVVGAYGYYRLYRRRRARFVFAVTLAFALLAEAMIVIAFAQNWRLSWWEWHTLMLAAFAVIALAARREWHEERFSPLYLEETLAGAGEATILFADLQGFTSFSENRHPGAVAAMLNTYLSDLLPLVERFGGEVQKIIGDAVMVVFNKAGDQPDHAVAAARASLAFQERAHAIAAAHPDWPRFRVGVNTGEVLTGVMGGERGHRAHDLVGDTVNLAARLEAQAAPGEVVIGAGTAERLPAGSIVEKLPPLRVRGKQQPIEAYVLRDLLDDLPS